MDNLKRETMYNYSSWDLNAKCVHIRNRQKIERMFKRTARRKNRQELKKELDKWN